MANTGIKLFVVFLIFVIMAIIGTFLGLIYGTNVFNTSHANDLALSCQKISDVYNVDSSTFSNITDSNAKTYWTNNKCATKPRQYKIKTNFTNQDFVVYTTATSDITAVDGCALQTCEKICGNMPYCLGFSRAKSLKDNDLGTCWFKKELFDNTKSYKDGSYQTWLSQ